jgi:hypothetical protein
LRGTTPRLRYSKRPPVSLRVLDAITTAPGSASAWRRAARFGVWPTTACSWGCSCTDQVADHDEPGGDAYANLERRTAMRCELRNRLDKIEPDANCALSIMFMRLGVAEIGENAVTHVFRHEPTVALDQVGAAVMIGADNPTQVLRIKLARQRGRTDQVTKHDS